MTETQARTTANVMLGAASAVAAVYVLRSPSLRRLAWRLARLYAVGPIAGWAVTTVAKAWDESDHRAPGRSAA